MLFPHLFAAVALCVVASSSGTQDSDCAGAVTRSTFEYSIVSRRNESGDWVSKVEGRRVIENGTDTVQMDFKQRVVECQGRQTLHFEGVFGGERRTEPAADRLTFHPNCGTNVAISNGGRTVKKINDQERFHGVGFSNRHLKINESFEVTIDLRSGNKFGYILGIGITTISPNDGEIINHANSLRSGTWMMYHNNVYNNGNILLKDRQQNLDQLKAGDRVGVRRNQSGSLFLAINGKEQAVASSVPYPVYGVLELFGDMVAVTLTP
ncbi:neuralized-like protein 4 isoform X2 [Ischnura elegans]|uniref:neuralized-like protein 4 isoform X2 n=1 Tax=Ischnura elegans TaxID=197161 RepID=UPI001ED89175|nr:neuralized-like protein 4 isoform X2 [Ischnura elegans]